MLGMGRQVSTVLRGHCPPLTCQVQEVFAKLRVILAKVCQSNALIGELDALAWRCHCAPSLKASRTPLHAAPGPPWSAAEYVSTHPHNVVAVPRDHSSSRMRSGQKGSRVKLADNGSQPVMITATGSEFHNAESGK